MKRMVVRRWLTVIGALVIAACVDIDSNDENAPGADATVIADFRAPRKGSGRIENAARRTAIVKAVFGSGAPTDVAIASSAEGAFTEANAAQTLYLLARGRPNASAIDARPPLLAVFTAGKLVTQFVPTGMSYAEITAVHDVNHDGLDEVLLTAHAYQMGQRISSSHLYSFKNGQRTLLQKFVATYENTCAAPFADGRIEAAVLRADSKHGSRRRVTRIDYTAPCQPNNAWPSLAAFSRKN